MNGIKPLSLFFGTGGWKFFFFTASFCSLKNIRYPGQYYDEESRLHFNWQRYYDPDIGRYYRLDPLASNRFIKNAYVYVTDNPINSKDSMGLQKETCNEDNRKKNLNNFLKGWKQSCSLTLAGEKMPMKIIRMFINDDNTSEFMEILNPCSFIHFIFEKTVGMYSDISDELGKVAE